MREFKFRAWNKEKKIMCFDNEDGSEEYMDGILSSDIGFINDRLSSPKQDERFGFLDYRNNYEVMQYTGLKDKNGVEIYEGDVGVLKNGSLLFQVYFDEGAFWIGEIGRSYDHYYGLTYEWRDFKVIGDRYTNPELLEEIK